MHFDHGAVQRHGFDLDADDLLALEALEDAVEHSGLAPAVHARVDGVPVAEVLRQPAPLAALLGHMQDGVEHAEVGQADVPPLPRQAVFNLAILHFGDFHQHT